MIGRFSTNLSALLISSTSSSYGNKGVWFLSSNTLCVINAIIQEFVVIQNNGE